MSATGGSAGIFNSTALTLGGVGSGGTVNSQGGWAWNNSSLWAGGGTFFGDGPLTTTSGNGSSVVTPGAGGSPGINSGVGAAGTAGIVLITEFISGSVTSITFVNFGMSPYTVLGTDQYLSVDTTGGVVVIDLPNAPVTGRVITIKDAVGNAAVNQITVTTVGGVVTIDGVTSYPMNVNYQSIELIFDGTKYEVF